MTNHRAPKSRRLTRALESIQFASALECIRFARALRSMLLTLVTTGAIAAAGTGTARADVLGDAFLTVREGNQADDKIGFAVSTAGDVNGDGYSDVLLQGRESNGTVWCYHGAPSGIAPAPSWTISGSQPNELMGVRPAPAGDVNGDGYDDVIIGMPLFSNGQFFEGAARVYLGSASGLATTPQITLESDVESATYGGSVDAAGDVNGDGFDDVIVGWSKYSNGQSFEGRALVYPGSAAGVQPTPIWSFESNVAQAGLGTRVSGAGDVNGDGFDDVLVSAPDLANGQAGEGRVYLFLGSAAGPAVAPSWTYESNVVGGRCGWGLGFAGDVNADGYSDIVFDTGTNNPVTGAALVFLGSPSGPGVVADRTYPSTSGAFGDAIYTAGDVNGDGCADIIAGDMSAGSMTGKIVILGGAETSATLPLLATRSGGSLGDEFGIDARPAGDVNGDGFGDVIVGAPFYDNGETDEGVVRIYLGKPSLPSDEPLFAPGGPQSGADFGRSVAQGDWNGDGFGDLAVGVPGFDFNGSDRGEVMVYYGGESGYPASPDWWTLGSTASGKYGYAIANAGDVDNDG